MTLGRQPKRFSVKAVGNCFVGFYRDLGYQEIPGSSLISEKLPMSFVMSAGMVQFEKLSNEQRQGDHFVLIQNCFRHFDLDQVGDSSFHLSLFQMPGAFDFGVIDNLATVRRIWELLTGPFGFDPQKLYATYSLGAKIAGTEFSADVETRDAWRTIGMPPDHILGLKGKSNFWKQSEKMVGVVNSRKCGPTTELFYDRGAYLGCSADCAPGCACGRFVEFMNNIFIKYEINDDGTIGLLPEPFVETVIGRERVAALLQGVDSVYEIDDLQQFIYQVRCFAHSQVLSETEQRRQEWLLVDHLRALLFLLNDGAPRPGKGGRAHIVRILMREILTSQRLLGISDPGFWRSMLFLARGIYPHLASVQTVFSEYLQDEDAKFRNTLQRSMLNFDELLANGKESISGDELLRYEKEIGVNHSLLSYWLWQKKVSHNLDEYKVALANFRERMRNVDDELV